MAAEHDALLRTKVERMLWAARDRIADSNLLEQSFRNKSDAGYLLRLLAFEILLKTAHLVHVGQPSPSHRYRELFDALPPDVGSALVAAAGECMSTSADYSNVSNLLAVFSRNFVALRYPYEAYEDLSAEEYAAIGESWRAKGCPEEEAKFVYHPAELFGLTHALDEHLQAWLRQTA